MKGSPQLEKRLAQRHEGVRIAGHEIVGHEPVEHVLQIFVLRVDRPGVVAARAPVLDLLDVHSEDEHVFLPDGVENLDVGARRGFRLWPRR